LSNVCSTRKPTLLAQNRNRSRWSNTKPMNCDAAEVHQNTRIRRPEECAVRNRSIHERLFNQESQNGNCGLAPRQTPGFQGKALEV
jgi:hypothetical protein